MGTTYSNAMDFLCDLVNAVTGGAAMLAYAAGMPSSTCTTVRSRACWYAEAGSVT
jgi:hypothetical protein